MEPLSRNPQSREQETAPEPAGTWQDAVKRIIPLGEMIQDYLSGLVELASLELKLAGRALPKLLMASLALLPFALLTWISFSAMAAWALYLWSGESLAGFAGFFGLQCLASVFCLLAIRKYRHDMSFPETRHHLNMLKEELRHEPETKNKEPQ